MNVTIATPSPADQVLQIVQDLHDLVDARMKVPALAAVFLHVFLRLGHLRDRLVRIVARIRAGRLPRVYTRDPEPIASVSERVRAPVQWPRKIGVLAEMLGAESALFAARLHVLLADPEAIAFILTNRPLTRYVRALCRTLGVPLVAALRLPRYKRIASRKGATPLDTVLPPVLSAPPPRPPLVAVMTTFTPSEDDAPMAVRVARYLDRRRPWRE